MTEEIPKPTILVASIDKKVADKADNCCKEIIDVIGKYGFTTPEKAYLLKVLVEGFEDAVARSKQDKMHG